MHGINASGLAVGWGDVGGGDVRMIAVSLAGPNGPVWSESGVSGNQNWDDAAIGVSTNGLIAGHTNNANGDARAYVWMVGSTGGTDLGTLPGDDGSVAIAINPSGTLIVGHSYHWLNNKKDVWLMPVVWTLNVVWHKGAPIATWVIHALPTDGLEQHGAAFTNDVLNNWGAWAVNDRGQIVGDAWSDRYQEIAVVWNPNRAGGWTLQRLPNVSASSGITYAYTEALSINNRGEIVGDMSADSWATYTPAYWTVSPPSRNYDWSVTELGSHQVAIAYGINDVGDIVGMNYDSALQLRATRWVTNDPGKAIPIDAPGDYSRAFAVNNYGVVVGRYRVGSTGPLQAFAIAIR